MSTDAMTEDKNYIKFYDDENVAIEIREISDIGEYWNWEKTDEARFYFYKNVSEDHCGFTVHACRSAELLDKKLDAEALDKVKIEDGTKLEICPFCGSSKLKLVRSEGHKDYYFHYYVKCEECDTIGPNFCTINFNSDTKQKAIEAWNRRVSGE